MNVNIKAIRTKQSNFFFGIKLGSNASYIDSFGMWSDIWTTYSETFNSTPSSKSWTKKAVNDLSFRVYLDPVSTGFQPECTQIYGVVNYDAIINPQIRTTQCYAVVNYTPATSTVTLSTPETLGVSHARNVQRIVFPDGDYRVGDYGRSGKTITLTGQETSTASAKMNSLKTMCHYGKYVTIDGLPDSNLNTDYMITGFSFNQEPGELNRYHWSLDLEEV